MTDSNNKCPGGNYSSGMCCAKDMASNGTECICHKSSNIYNSKTNTCCHGEYNRKRKFCCEGGYNHEKGICCPLDKGNVNGICCTNPTNMWNNNGICCPKDSSKVHRTACCPAEEVYNPQQKKCIPKA